MVTRRDISLLEKDYKDNHKEIVRRNKDISAEAHRWEANLLAVLRLSMSADNHDGVLPTEQEAEFYALMEYVL